MSGRRGESTTRREEGAAAGELTSDAILVGGVASRLGSEKQPYTLGRTVFACEVEREAARG